MRESHGGAALQDWVFSDIMPEQLPIIDTVPRDAFLALFQPYFAGRLTELFLDVGPRAGIVMPVEIMSAVIYQLRSRIAANDDPVRQEEWRGILVIVAENWDKAEAFADYCVHYSALPERFRLALQRTSRAGGILEKMRAFAPSDGER